MVIPFSVVSLLRYRRDPKTDWNTLKTYTLTYRRNTGRGKDTNFDIVKEISMKQRKLWKWVISIPAPKSVMIGQGEGSTTKWGSVFFESLINLRKHKI